MIGEYTYSELTDMHIVFSGAYRSTLQAQHLSQEDFPGRRVPDIKTFSSIDQRPFHNYNAITKN
jgi:hypothetical protein